MKKKSPFSTIRGRLIGLILIASALVLGSSILFLSMRTKRELIDSAFQRLSAVAEIKEDTINRWIEEQRREAEFLIQRPSLHTLAMETLKSGHDGTSADELKAYLRELLIHKPDLESILLLSTRGGEVFAGTEEDLTGEFLLDAKYYKRGLLGLYVENLYPSPYTLKPAITVSAPLRNEENTTFAVLALQLELAAMDRIINERTGLGETGKAFLVDQFNVPVLGRQYGDKSFRRGIHSPGIDKALKGGRGSGNYVNHEGVKVLGVYRWLEGRNMALIVEMEEREAFSAIRSFYLFIIALGTVLFLLALFFSFQIARTISSPILNIRDAALEVSRGDLNVQTEVQSQDEVGELSKAFNGMVDELRCLYDTVRSNERYFKSLIEGAFDLIFVLRRDGTISYVSPAVQTLLGISPEELLETPMNELLSSDTERKKLKEAVLSAKETPGETCLGGNLEFIDTHKESHIFASSLCDLLSDPAVKGIVINSRDISKEEELKRRLAQAQKLEAVGRLAGRIAHDFNNLLAGVSGYATLLAEDDREDPELLETAQAIQKIVRRGADLTKNLLAFTKSQEMHPRVVETGQLLERIEKLTGTQPGGGGTYLVQMRRDELADEFLHQSIYIDLDRIETALSHIIANALEAQESKSEEEREIKLSLEEEIVSTNREIDREVILPGRYMKLTLSDPGEGMDGETLIRAMDPFFTTKIHQQRLGLGLSIAYGIIRQAGAYMFLDSVSGRGTEVQLLFPVQGAP